MKFQFTAQENDETGEIGWMDNRAKFPYNPQNGAAVLAHDCLEHFGLSCISDEIEAMGVIYWLRYETGYTYPKTFRGIETRDLTADFVSIFESFSQNDLPLELPKIQKRLDEHIESHLEDIIRDGKHLITLENPDNDNLAIFEERFADYFRIGYRKAQKRYGKIGQDAACDMFTELFYIFDKNRPEFEGQKFSVNINTHTGQVSYSEVY